MRRLTLVMAAVAMALCLAGCGSSVDKSNLQALVEEANAIDQSLYSDETVEKLNTWISASEVACKDDDVEADFVAKCETELRAAIDGLEEPVVDKSELEALIADLETTSSDIYTEESYNNLVSALVAGTGVVESEAAKQADVDAAIDEINAAFSALEEAFNPSNYSSVAYKDIARNPDDFEGERIVFSGRVVQVIESTSETKLRVATSGKYDDVILVAYDPDIIDFRVLEDDTIKAYGKCLGLYTYEATSGKPISIPSMYCDVIELK